jgi:hemerythrin-like domain-containing protein
MSTTMSIVALLLGEHAVLRAVCGCLEQAVAATESLAQIRMQAVLLAAPLDAHAHLEDALLFTELAPYLGEQAGPLAVLRREHDEIEAALASAQDAGEPRRAQEQLLNALERIRSHFDKEEQVLFPLAERLLDVDRLVTLGRQWAASRHIALP